MFGPPGWIGPAQLYELPYEHGYSGPGLDAVGRALRQAAPAVRADPEQLAGQLLGRLDGCGDPLLAPLLEAAAAATAATRDHEDDAVDAWRGSDISPVTRDRCRGSR